MDLEETIDDLAPRLLRYLRGRTTDVALAEDVAQDTLAALVGRWRRHGPPESAAAFAFTIARRRLFRLRSRRLLDRSIDALRGREDPAPSAERRLVQAGELVQLHGALATLSQREREVLLLIAGARLDQSTVARVLGISVSAVKMRLHRARKRLLELRENAYETA